MILIPTVVLLPQWVIDDINKLVATSPVDAFLTDENRANGWTAEMLAGGMALTHALTTAINAAEQSGP